MVIAGHDGGTGARRWSSIKHAGTPLGARPGRDAADPGAEPPARPHRVQADGQMKTGRDVVDRRAARRRRVRLRHRAAGGRRLHHDAQVPPQTPARWASPRRTRCCAKFTGQARSTSSTSSSSSPRKPARSWRSWASAPRRWSAAPTCSTCAGVEHWKAKGAWTSAKSSSLPPVPAECIAPPCGPRDHGLEKALDHKLIAKAKAAIDAAKAVHS